MAGTALLGVLLMRVSRDTWVRASLRTQGHGIGTELTLGLRLVADAPTSGGQEYNDNAFQSGIEWH